MLVRPYPERVAAIPFRTTSTRPAASSPTWTPTSIITPTELSGARARLPERLQVDCSGCQTEQQPGELVVKSAPPGDPARLTITRK